MAQSHLLGISLVHERFLLVEQFFLKFLFSQLGQLLLSRLLFLDALLLLLLIANLALGDVFLLSHQVLVLALLIPDSLEGLLVIVLARFVLAVE